MLSPSSIPEVIDFMFSPQNFTRPTIPTLSEWRYVSKQDAARITVTDNQQLDTSNTVTSAIASLLPGYTNDNEKVYANLFASIHYEYPVQSTEIKKLLEGDLKNGVPLTSKMVAKALNIATMTTEFCLAWNDLAMNLSTRGDLGKEFIQEFNLLVSDRFTSANALNNADKAEVLNKLKDEFKNNKITSELKNRLGALIDLEIQRLNFATNVEKLKNCPQLSSMTNPARDCWRLVMDGGHQDKGIHHFENEQGYMQGMLRGLNLMIATLDEPLTADLYRTLHDAAVDKVYERDNLQTTMKKGYSECGVGFDLIMGINCTEAGLAEYRKKSGVVINESGQTRRLCAAYNPEIAARMEDDKCVTQVIKTRQQICDEHVTEIIDTYNKELRIAKEINDPLKRETAILTCIAKCCQDLDQHHVFEDGNIRTVVFLVMNKLLLKNKLAPVILKEPNAVDMFSLEQIVSLMREGQKTFRTYTTSQN